jgi:hypothetical protein
LAHVIDHLSPLARCFRLGEITILNRSKDQPTVCSREMRLPGIKQLGEFLVRD